MKKTGRWLSRPDVRLMEDGVTIKLLNPLKYLDVNDRCWVAPKDALGDGASIPRMFWSVVGSPLTGKYRDASIIHDFYCSTRTRPWKDVHRVFYEAMICSQVPYRKAKTMYAAVYFFGPHWTDMDSQNASLLASPNVGATDLVHRNIKLFFEDCTGPIVAPEDDVPVSDEASESEGVRIETVLEQTQTVFYFGHSDAEADARWVEERFDNDEEMELDEIDAAIEQRMAQKVSAVSATRYHEMS